MSTESEVQQTKFVFKARYGAAVPKTVPRDEPTHEDIDDFVRSILGLKPDQKIHR